jgi:hypothetical protein
LDRDFKRNPEKAQAYYGCKPLESGIGFIRDLEKLEKIKDPNLRNPLDTLGRFDSWFKPSPYARNTYFCHIDLALGKIDEAGFQTSDVAALAMGHKEESGIIIIDLMKRYTAPATGKEVEFASIRQDIIDLKTRGFNIKKITIDGWQSKDSMQILQRQGFEVELLAIDKGMAHWDTFKEVVITERVKTYGHFPGEIWGTQVDNVLIHELRHLVLVDGKKVDHLDISSKDISDCVCGVVSNAIAFEEAGFSFAKL